MFLLKGVIWTDAHTGEHQVTAPALPSQGTTRSWEIGMGHSSLELSEKAWPF